MNKMVEMIFYADIARALIEALGMHAENMQRQAVGASMAYVEESFIECINRNGLDVNSVIIKSRQACE